MKTDIIRDGGSVSIVDNDRSYVIDKTINSDTRYWLYERVNESRVLVDLRDSLTRSSVMDLLSNAYEAANTKATKDTIAKALNIIIKGGENPYSDDRKFSISKVEVLQALDMMERKIFGDVSTVTDIGSRITQVFALAYMYSYFPPESIVLKESLMYFTNVGDYYTKI